MSSRSSSPDSSFQPSGPPTLRAGAMPTRPCYWNLLPPELKNMVADRIDDQKDRASLCRTSKEFRQIVTAALYRAPSITFFGKAAQRKSQLTHMLSESNPGLKHIQRVNWVLMRTEGGKPCEQWSILSQLIREMLLMHLGRDQLRQLSIRDIHANGKIAHNLTLHELSTTLSKQSELTQLDIGMFNRDLSGMASTQIIEQMLPLLTKVTSIHLKPYTHECDAAILAARVFAQDTGTIKELKIEAGHVGHEPGRAESILAPQHLAKHIKTSIPNFDAKCAPPLLTSLKSLELVNMSLGADGIVFAQLLQPRQLETLKMMNCSCVEQFYQSLKDRYYTTSSTRLKTFVFSCHDEVDQTPAATNASVSAFLGAFSGLERLFFVNTNVGFHNRVPPVPASSILAHAEMIRLLLVQGALSTSDVYTKEGLESICQGCLQLEHIGLSFPVFDLADDLTSGLLGSYMTTLSSVKKLQTLSIANWPEMEDIDPEYIGPGAYFSLVNGVASKMFRLFCNGSESFEKASSTNLRPRAIQSGGHHEDAWVMALDESVEPEIYYPQEIERPQGRKTITARLRPAPPSEKLDMELLKFRVEPLGRDE